MRWEFGASLGLVSLALLAAGPAQAATTELGAVGFVNAGLDPDGNPQYLAGVQAAESNPMPFGFRPYVIPAGYGVVTQWSHSTGTVSGALAFAVMRDYPGNQYIKVGSDVQTVQAFTVHRFATRIPVRPGDRFLVATEKQGGPPYHQLYTTTTSLDNRVAELTDYTGGPQTVDKYWNGHLLDVAARVETDADGDGFGDDTQDGCPSRADIQGACPSGQGGAGGKDAEKPKVGKPKFSSTVFRAASSGKAFATGGRTVPVGTRVTFTASEASSVRFRVQRRTTGRKVGKKCKAPTRKNRKRKQCTRYATVKGSFTIDATPGTNAFAFRGRIAGRKLKPGRYRLAGQATDRAKNTSNVPARAFRIVK